MSEFDLDIRVTKTAEGPGAQPNITASWMSSCCTQNSMCCTNTCQTHCVCSQPGWTCVGGADGARC